MASISFFFAHWLCAAEPLSGKQCVERQLDRAYSEKCAEGRHKKECLPYRPKMNKLLLVTLFETNTSFVHRDDMHPNGGIGDDC